jgi:uncharacterized protein YggE
MRLVGLAALAALALGATAAPGQETARPAPVPIAPLAANEMLLELNVAGEISVPADRIVVTMFYTARGETSAAARTAAEAIGRRLEEAGRGFGAELVPTAMGQGPVTLAAALAGGSDEIGVTPASPNGSLFAANGSMRLRIADASRFPQLRAALEAAGAFNILGPLYLLNDESEAHRAARLDALAKARSEAESFARAQHMRVVRLVRFSEGDDTSAAGLRLMMSQFAGGSFSDSRAVKVSVSVQAAFVLASQ